MMQYTFAPLEGLSDHICRCTHARFYPGEAAPEAYFAPFVSPTKDMTVDPRKWKDVLPENNVEVPLVPQMLTKSAEQFLWLAGELAALGYTEVNLNVGCPAGTVVAKGKGSGMLRSPVLLDHFLEEIFSQPLPLQVSVKTRLGIASPEEFPAVLDIYNKYPLRRLIVHPRVQKDIYRNEPRMEAFAYAAQHSRAPLCYNGSLLTAAQVLAVQQQYPQLEGIMLGRGLIANPDLLRQVRTGLPPRKELLYRYMDALYREYAAAYGNPQNAVRHMKGHWHYTMAMFEDDRKLEKTLQRAASPYEYETAVEQVFALLAFRADAREVR